MTMHTGPMIAPVIGRNWALINTPNVKIKNTTELYFKGDQNTMGIITFQSTMATAPILAPTTEIIQVEVLTLRIQLETVDTNHDPK